MKLSRKDELRLINLGLKVLLEREFNSIRVKPRNMARKWTEAQRKKFIATMKAKRNQAKGKLRIA